ncbi:MAG: transposase [Eggerthellaceae bacterium]|nr:transposase [Eggerthellaceae bacterium]
MPSRARKHSETGFYHITQVGAGRQIIFDSDSDKLQYVQLLRNAVSNFSFTILAWCLMSNHTHIVARAEPDELSRAMHDIGFKYAQYFNGANGHEGPVFQSRFFSEPIEQESYLLAAIRYVHNNPESAQICKAEEYRWSSYRSYLRGGGLADTQLVLEMLGGTEKFVEFSKQPDTFETNIEPESIRSRLTDDEAREVVNTIVQPLSLAELKTLPRERRNELLQEIKRTGIGVRQIQRLTGIGLGTISRA